MLFIMPMLTGCHVQWVSPYSADLQKKATDMLPDVVARESHMRSAADPRHPDVLTKFETWRGDVEAMSEIELSIDPGATVCDRGRGIPRSACRGRGQGGDTHQGGAECRCRAVR